MLCSGQTPEKMVLVLTGPDELKSLKNVINIELLNKLKPVFSQLQGPDEAFHYSSVTFYSLHV